jgi:hypothetical protein
VSNSAHNGGPVTSGQTVAFGQCLTKEFVVAVASEIDPAFSLDISVR